MNKRLTALLGVVALASVWAPRAGATTWDVTIGDDEVTEGTDAFAHVAVTLSPPAPEGGLCLQISLGTGSDDTATPSIDYQAPVIQLVYHPGESNGLATIPIIADAEAESDEVFTVSAVEIKCTVDSPLVGADVSDTGSVLIHNSGGELPPSGSGLAVPLTILAGALLAFGSASLAVAHLRRRDPAV